MQFNLPAAAVAYADIAHAIGVASPEQSPEEAGQAAIDAIRLLFQQIGIPESLRAIGVKDEHIDDIAALSLNAKRLIENNPRLLDEAGIREILANAMA